MSSHRSASAVFQVLLRSEEHTSELQSLAYLVCRLLLEKKKHGSQPLPHKRPHSEPYCGGAKTPLQSSRKRESQIQIKDTPSQHVHTDLRAKGPHAAAEH